MTDLLVASGGGHLEQLWALHTRIPDLAVDHDWITYPGIQADSLLGRYGYVPAHYPTTRSVANALRNARLAFRILSSRPYERLITTGAGLAPPFIAVATGMGVSCHFIESATRFDGPSLSGRLVAAVPGVSLYRQHQEAVWSPRWKYAGSVYDGVIPVMGSAVPSGPLRFFLGLGTHDFPFPRAVDLVRSMVRRGDALVVQAGSTAVTPKNDIRVASVLPRPQLVAEMSAADVVFIHAGTGLVKLAHSVGKLPVIIPRRGSLKEHVDDHQLETAEALASRGLALVADADFSPVALRVVLGSYVETRTSPDFQLESN